MTEEHEMLELIGATRIGWEADDTSLICPCGHRIEPDADQCRDGCPNPLRAAGMI